jgi:hypothetical protein
MPRLPKGFSAACRGLPGVLLFCALAITTAAAADKEKPTMKQATGTFTVSLQPMQDPDAVPDPAMGRMRLDKHYLGGLVADAHGQMLTGMGGVPGSAAYVAIERVEGTLDGRKGGFLLAHRGVMHAGTQSLEIAIVPDSGNGALSGIAGTLAIRIADGVHHYVLDYTLPPE